MTGNVIDFGAYQRLRARDPQGHAGWTRRAPLGAMPGAVRRILHFMLDAPDDPPLVKLAWLLSYFGAVPLPDGQMYRLKRGRLDVKRDSGWVASPITLDGLAHLVTGLKRQEWQAIAQSCRRRETVLRLDDLWPGTIPPGSALV